MKVRAEKVKMRASSVCQENDSDSSRSCSSSSSSSSLEVPLNIRLKHKMANRMDQQQQLLHSQTKRKGSNRVEDDFVLVASTTSTSNATGKKDNATASKQSSNKENNQSLANKGPTKNINDIKKPQYHTLKPMVPKPPPPSMSGGGGSWYCSRIDNNNRQEETKTMHSCDCCRPPLSGTASQQPPPMTLVVDIMDSDDDDDEDGETVAAVVVPDCSPTSAAEYKNNPRKKQNKSRKNTQQHPFDDSSDGSTESNDGPARTTSNDDKGITSNADRISIKAKTTKSKQQQYKEDLILSDSSSSSSDDSFMNVVRKVTAKKTNPTGAFRKVNSTVAAIKQRKKPLRIIDDDNSSSDEEDDVDWDGDDESEQSKQHNSTSHRNNINGGGAVDHPEKKIIDEDSLVDRMGRVDIQDNNTHVNRNNTDQDFLTRPSRTRRPQRKAAAARRIEELTFSDDDSYDVSDKMDTVDEDNYESSFIEISSDDNDDDQDSYVDTNNATHDDESGGNYDDDDSFISVEPAFKVTSKKPKPPISIKPTKEKPLQVMTPNRKPLVTRKPEPNGKLTSQTAKKPKMSKKEFQQKRETLGKETFERFNRTAFDGKLASVGLVWSKKLNKTAGITRMATVSRGKIVVRREASIELATKVIDDIDRLHATLLHEMCHAADWMIDNNPKPDHGAGFKKWANIAMRQVPGIIVTTKHTYEIAYKYAWACTSPTCNAVIKRHSRSVDVSRQCCGRCKGKLVEIEQPKKGVYTASSKGAMGHTPKKKAAPSVYNLFIKDKSKEVREKLNREHVAKGNTGKVPQGEVMKECARLWKEKKVLEQK